VQGPDVVRNTSTSAHQRRKTESNQATAAQRARQASGTQRPSPSGNKPSGTKASGTKTSQNAATQRNKAQKAMADALRTYQQQTGTGSRPRTPSGSASGRPTYGTAPKAGAGKKKSSNVSCCLIVLLIAAGIIFKGVVPLIGGIVDLFTSDSSTGTKSHSVGTNDFQAKLDAEKRTDRIRVVNDSEHVVKQFISADPELVKELSSSNSSYDARLLTRAQAKAAMGPNPQWTRTSATVTGWSATVSGTLKTRAGDVPMQLRYTKSGDAWELDPPTLPVVRTIGEDLPAGTTINGTRVSLNSTQASSGVLVWPGQVTVRLPADKFTTYAKRTQTFKAVSAVSSTGSSESISVAVTPKRTAEFNKQARAAAAANLKKCLSATTLDPKGCPFGGSVSNSVSKISNVHFTQTVPVKKWEITGSYGSEDVWGTGGEVAVSATGWKTTGSGQGYTTRITGDWDTFVGSVAVKKGKVVFTAH
jgi:hypothetical protein